MFDVELITMEAFYPEAIRPIECVLLFEVEHGENGLRRTPTLTFMKVLQKSDSDRKASQAASVDFQRHGHSAQVWTRHIVLPKA